MKKIKTKWDLSLFYKSSKDSKIKKDQIITTRVSKELKEFLESDSKKNDITTSNYVEKILLERQQWEKTSQDIKLIEVFREFFIELLQRVNVNDIEKIGSDLVANLIRDAIIFEKGELTLPNIFSLYERWIRHNGMSSKHLTKENTETFIFNHSLGKNFSIMNYKAWETIVNLLKLKVQSKEISDNILIFEVTK